jgi:two-component system phosphate regulon response regulator PhoB
MAKIVVASTDADYYLLLSHILSEAGFSVLVASSSAEVIHQCRQSRPIAILLDCRSGEDLALSSCQDLKDDPETFGIQTVVLIAPGAEHQYLNLMRAGMDESFVRPIAPSKLIGFLEDLAGLPVSGLRHRDGRDILVHRDIEIDLDAHRVSRKGIPVHLGPIEFRILRHLMENAGRICTRDALVEAGWQQGRFVDRRTINVHMGRLRKALGESGGDLIRTVRSAGYVLETGSGSIPDEGGT